VHQAVPESAECRHVTLVSPELEAITGLDEINCNTFALKTAQARVELANNIPLICCSFEVFY
jgi:hypothetical protein